MISSIGIGGIGGLGGFGGGGIVVVPGGGIGGGPGGGFGGGHGGGFGGGYGGGGYYPGGGYGGHSGFGGGETHHHHYGNGTGTGGGGSCNGQNNCNGYNNGFGNNSNGTALNGGFGNFTRLSDDIVPEDSVKLDDEPQKASSTESSKSMAIDANQKPAVSNAATVAALPQSQGIQNFPAFYPIFSAQIAAIPNAYVPQQQQPQSQQPSTTKSAKPETPIKEPVEDVEPGKDENKINPSGAATNDVQPENIVVPTTPSTIPTNGIVSNFVLSPSAQFTGNSFVQVPSSYLPNNGVQNNGVGFVSNLVLNPALTADSQSSQNTDDAPTTTKPISSALQKPQRDSTVSTANEPSTERTPSASFQPIFSGGSCNGENNCNKKN